MEDPEYALTTFEVDLTELGLCHSGRLLEVMDAQSCLEGVETVPDRHGNCS